MSEQKDAQIKEVTDATALKSAAPVVSASVNVVPPTAANYAGPAVTVK
jgi:hypothetical protein